MPPRSARPLSGGSYDFSCATSVHSHRITICVSAVRGATARTDGGDAHQHLGSSERQGYSTAGAMCPENRFAEALDRISKLLPGVVDRMGGSTYVKEYYMARQANNVCVQHAMSGQGQALNWPGSAGAFPRARLDGSGNVNGMLINAGSGETGMPFLGCVLSRRYNPTRMQRCATSPRRSCAANSRSREAWVWP